MVREILFIITGLRFPKKSNHIKREGKKGLELDCYNEEIKVAIEVNGIQHYKRHKLFHDDEKDFEEQKERDQIKIIECKKMGIILIIIPYQYNYQNIKKLYDYVYNQLEINGVFKLLEEKGFIIRVDKYEYKE
jgi:hypothetical protein